MAPSRADLEEARAHFLAGRAAIEAGRWADAVESFERAYALSHAPSALYNVAVALRALGRYREARDTLRRLLQEHEERLRPARRQEAERYLREAEAQVASLRLEGLAAGVRHEVRLDARPIEDDGSRPLRIETDPGEHVLEVSRPEHVPFEWRGAMGAGEHQVVQVALRPRPRPRERDPLRASVPARPQERGGGLFSSPWFWVGTGVVVAVAAGATWWYLTEGRGPAGPSPQSPRVVDLGAWQ